jgi:hypothetical protein
MTSNNPKHSIREKIRCFPGTHREKIQTNLATLNACSSHNALPLKPWSEYFCCFHHPILRTHCRQLEIGSTEEYASSSDNKANLGSLLCLFKFMVWMYHIQPSFRCIDINGPQIFINQLNTTNTNKVQTVIWGCLWIPNNKPEINPSWALLASLINWPKISSQLTIQNWLTTLHRW